MAKFNNTGLPDLPPGQYWKVTPTASRGQLDFLVVHLMRRFWPLDLANEMVCIGPKDDIGEQLRKVAQKLLDARTPDSQSSNRQSEVASYVGKYPPKSLH